MLSKHNSIIDLELLRLIFHQPTSNHVRADYYTESLSWLTDFRLFSLYRLPPYDDNVQLSLSLSHPVINDRPGVAKISAPGEMLATRTDQ